MKAVWYEKQGLAAARVLGVAIGTLLAIHARLKAAKQDFEAWLARQGAR